MDSLNAFLIRHLLAPTAYRGLAGVLTVVFAAIVACEIRTMGMGLHRSDGRNVGIADPVLLQIMHLIEAALPIL